PARYLAFKHEATSIRNEQGVPKAWISRRMGGDQIDYVDEKPEIRKLFTEALAKHDLKPRMEEAYRVELAESASKAA
ncbi:MAG TPA: ethanolamine ammonia lyase-activating protein, partial [Burkholderiales bacterium]|nr:ethanolamine ammonia lyase-activating protein [Burkholderiales bacterium]